MPNKPPPVYWDACLFLSYIEETEDRAPVLEALLDEAVRGKVDIVTSTVTLVEVAFHEREKHGKELDPEIERQIAGLFDPPSPVKLVEFHRGIGESARGLMRDAVPNGWSLKGFDAIHLATAKYIEATKLLTYDKKLFKYNTAIGLPVVPPELEQTILVFPKSIRALPQGDVHAEP